MPASVPLSSLRRHLPGQYLWPVLLLVATCFACIVTVLVATTQAQDRMQLARERQSLERGLQTAADMIVHDLQDYAKWDEAVRHISNGVDHDWVADNIDAYLGDTQGYSYLFVLDGRNRTVFSSRAGTLASADAHQILGVRLGAAIARVRGMPISGTPILGGYIRSGDHFYIYSVAQVVPLTGKIRLYPGPTHLLAIAQRIDGAFLNRLTATHHIRGLAVQPERPTSQPSVAMIGIGGATQGWLSWHPDSPGTVLRRQNLPIFFAVALIHCWWRR